jgi:hypothetical protein
VHTIFKSLEIETTKMNDRVEDDGTIFLSQGGWDQESGIEQVISSNEEEGSPSTAIRSQRLWRLVKLSVKFTVGVIALPWLMIKMCSWVSNNCGFDLVFWAWAACCLMAIPALFLSLYTAIFTLSGWTHYSVKERYFGFLPLVLFSFEVYIFKG